VESCRVAGTQIEKLSYDSLTETPPVILSDSVQFGFTWNNAPSCLRMPDLLPERRVSHDWRTVCCLNRRFRAFQNEWCYFFESSPLK
jgi:hypothetical protein